ncbi:archease [Sulfurirhabdus autotrophica]|uniref:SHS2 domain-containing protein n=1 Tax=Sulfurirhabdus autotrophica TaxID=1706046 RepID=A0A4R3YHH3_9PROT|nr:archease [Sulfurirhabdus autotrophica]TCV90434.1 SHS2 domain-containing protein [Sulfurirhabdus autotrophica]
MDAGDYSYFDHDADIGIIGHGKCLEAAFESAAKAMFAIMAELEQIKPVNEINLSFEESDLEYALVTWLNLLITEARENGLALGKFYITRNKFHWHGKAWGEPWRAGLERGVEVKGATLTMLSVKNDGNEWEARCIVDV